MHEGVLKLQSAGTGIVFTTKGKQTNVNHRHFMRGVGCPAPLSPLPLNSTRPALLGTTIQHNIVIIIIIIILENPS